MRPTRSSALAVLALMCSGCFEATVQFTLCTDGSGTQSLHLAMDAPALATLRGAVGVVDAASRGVDPIDVFDAAKVRAELLAAGLGLEAHRTFEVGDRRRVEVTARFGDLAELRANPLAGGARATWQVTGGDTPGEVRLVYYPMGEAAWRSARDKARALAQEPDALIQHFVASRLRQIEGLDVTLSFDLPGDVLAHTANLQLAGKRRVSARIVAADIRTATDLLVRLAPRYEVVFACPRFPLDPAPGSARPGPSGRPTAPAGQEASANARQRG